MILGYCSASAATPALAPRGAVQSGGMGLIELREAKLPTATFHSARGRNGIVATPAEPVNRAVRYAALQIGTSDGTYRAYTAKSVPDPRVDTAPRQVGKSER